MDELEILPAELSAPDPMKRQAAAQRLAQLGLAAQPAAVALARATGDTEAEVANWATAALEELGPPLPIDVSALADLLTVAEGDVAYWAATLLGRLGDSARDAVPALIVALETCQSLAARQRAAWALGAIGPAAAAAGDALRRAARSEDPRLARLASQALTDILKDAS